MDVERDCDGICFGDTIEDDCGVCGGIHFDEDNDGIFDNGDCDCDGNVLDCAGVCGGDSEIDCSGVCGGDAYIDDCGSCQCGESGEGDCLTDEDDNYLDYGCGCDGDNTEGPKRTWPMYLNKDVDNMTFNAEENVWESDADGPLGNNIRMGVSIIDGVSPKIFCTGYGTITTNNSQDENGNDNRPELLPTTSMVHYLDDSSTIESVLAQGQIGPYNPDNWVSCGPTTNIGISYALGFCEDATALEAIGFSGDTLLVGCMDENATLCNEIDYGDIGSVVEVEIDELTPEGCYNPYALVDAPCVYDEVSGDVTFRLIIDEFLPILSQELTSVKINIRNVNTGGVLPSQEMTKINPDNSIPFNLIQVPFYEITLSESDVIRKSDLLEYDYEIGYSINSTSYTLSDNIKRYITVDRFKPTYIDYTNMDYFYNYFGDFQSSIVPIIKVMDYELSDDLTSPTTLHVIDNRYSVLNELGENEIFVDIDGFYINSIDTSSPAYKPKYTIFSETSIDILESSNRMATFEPSPMSDKLNLKEDFINSIWEEITFSGNSIKIIPFNLMIENEYKGLYTLKSEVRFQSDDESPIVIPVERINSKGGSWPTNPDDALNREWIRVRWDGDVYPNYFELGDVAQLIIPQDFAEGIDTNSSDMSGVYYVCEKGEGEFDTGGGTQGLNLCCHPDSPKEFTYDNVIYETYCNKCCTGSNDPDDCLNCSCQPDGTNCYEPNFPGVWDCDSTSNADPNCPDGTVIYEYDDGGISFMYEDKIFNLDTSQENSAFLQYVS